MQRMGAIVIIRGEHGLQSGWFSNPPGLIAQIAPGAGDGDGESGALDIDEQGGAVGREAGAAELAFVGMGIHRKGVDFAIGSESTQIVNGVGAIGITVFADDQITPGRDRNVIAGL